MIKHMHTWVYMHTNILCTVINISMYICIKYRSYIFVYKYVCVYLCTCIYNIQVWLNYWNLWVSKNKIIKYWWKNICIFNVTKRLPWWLSSKELACNAWDSGSIPGLGRSPGGGNGNPLWYSCLRNPLDRGAWWATVHGVAKEFNMT